MSKKVVIITGANSGIGKAAAKKFASQGHKVIIACRNIEKSQQALQEIKAASNNPEIELMKLDISSFLSIHEFCEQFNNKYDKLDILIHNAAYFNHGEKKYQLTEDNIEVTFATNMFGPFLMTKLLVNQLAKSDDPRILHALTTNIRHFFDPKRAVELDHLHGEFKDSKPYNVYKRYGDSKMGLLMLSFKMAEEFKSHGIKTHAVQIPAIKMSRETIQKLSPLWKIAARLQNLFIPEPETMADTYYDICCSEKWQETSGVYINDKREIIKSSHYGTDIKSQIKQFLDKSVYPRYADNQEMMEKIWKLCVEVCATSENNK